jgi:phospholipase/carboxylesterase
LKTTLHEDRHQVTLSPANSPADASVIWMHGLGADGHDFVPLIPELGLPAEAAIRFIFPHARVRPVSINGGMSMRAWYDIRGISRDVDEDEAGLRESAASVERLIRREREDGVAAARILLAGFSQGGAMALYTALRHAERLGGIIALSTYLPARAQLAAEAAAANRDVPILMCHGTGDPVVPYDFGRQSRDALLGLGYAVEWKSYPMAHQLCAEEIGVIAAWLRARLA